LTIPAREIGIFLAENRLVTILKELTVTVMSPVEGNRMTSKKAGHDGVEGSLACFQDQMNVIAEESPCVTRRVGFGKHLPDSLDKTVFVDIVTEDQSPLNPPDDDVMDHTFGVKTGMAGHGQS
jgi:hypothetical protein